MSNPFGIQSRKNQKVSNKPQKQTFPISNRYCSSMSNNNEDLFNNDNNISNKNNQLYQTPVQTNSIKDDNNSITLFETEIKEDKKEDAISNIFDIGITNNTDIFQPENTKQTSLQQVQNIFSGNDDEIKDYSNNIEKDIKNNNTNIQEDIHENGETKNIFKKEEPLLYNGNKFTNIQNEPMESLFENKNDNLNSNSSNNNILKDNYSFPNHNNIIPSDNGTNANGYETQIIQFNETETNAKGENLQLLEDQLKYEEEINKLKNEVITLKGELNLANIKMSSIQQELQVYQNNILSQNQIINQYKMKQLNEDFYLNELEILKKELQEKNKFILFLENTNKTLNDNICEQKEIIQELTAKEEITSKEPSIMKTSENIVEMYKDDNNKQSNEIKNERDNIQKEENQTIKEEKDNPFIQRILNTKKEEEHIEEIKIDSNNNTIENNQVNEQVIAPNKDNEESDNALYGIQPTKSQSNKHEEPLTTKIIENEISSTPTSNIDSIFKSSEETVKIDNQIKPKEIITNNKITNPSPKKHKPSFDFNLAEEEDVDSLFSSIHQTSNDNKHKSSIFD